MTAWVRKHWYLLLAAAGIVGLALGTAAFGAAVSGPPEPTPTPTAVTDAVRQAHCLDYWLDTRPANDDWSEAVTQMYVDQTDRMCARIVSEDDDAFTP